jgi:integrase
VTIGTYPAVSLADAREQASKIIRDVQLGVFDQPAKAEALTLEEAVQVFIQLYAKPKNRRWKDAERLLGEFRTLFDRPLNSIKRSDVVRVLDAVVASGRPYSANRALSHAKKLMNWALDRGMFEVNPIAGLKPPAKENPRDRVLTDEELGALLRAADAEGYPFGYLFQLLLFTGQRRNEVAGMRWSEIDFGSCTWTIPRGRSKNGQTHVVPLSEPVLEILRSEPRFLNSDYVLTTTGTTPISGFGRAKDRLDQAMGASDWRIHDLRRTAASGMARLGVTPHEIERVLNHKSGIISGVAAVYNRYGYEKETRAALASWGDHLKPLASNLGQHVSVHSLGSPIAHNLGSAVPAAFANR